MNLVEVTDQSGGLQLSHFLGLQCRLVPCIISVDGHCTSLLSCVLVHLEVALGSFSQELLLSSAYWCWWNTCTSFSLVTLFFLLALNWSLVLHYCWGQTVYDILLMMVLRVFSNNWWDWRVSLLSILDCVIFLGVERLVCLNMFWILVIFVTMNVNIVQIQVEIVTWRETHDDWLDSIWRWQTMRLELGCVGHSFISCCMIILYLKLMQLAVADNAVLGKLVRDCITALFTHEV